MCGAHTSWFPVVMHSIVNTKADIIEIDYPSGESIIEIIPEVDLSQ